MSCCDQIVGDKITCLKCVLCGREYDDEALYTCPTCNGELDVIYDYHLISSRLTRESLAHNRDHSIWRYGALLPVRTSGSRRPTLKVGWTPLYLCPELGGDFDLPNLMIKDDGRNPTASLKDRASAIGVVKAQELGYDVITCASTGNAASSLAGMCANVGMKNYIFVPETIPRPKLAQLLIYGAQVIPIRGSYDQAFDLCLAASDRFGWYSRNTGYNPYLSEGKKTAALEICEQLDWKPPDYVVVSVGDGCIIGGLWKGFFDLYNLNFIDAIPKLIGVQAEGAKPIVDAIQGDGDIKTVIPKTVADSICVGHPRDGNKALRAIRRSKGTAISVSDEEILRAETILARRTGIFAEPAAAAAFAGFVKLANNGMFRSSETALVIITGSGLKDIDTIEQAMEKPLTIEPIVEEVSRIVQEDL